MKTDIERELEDSERRYALRFASSVAGRPLTNIDVHQKQARRIFDALSRVEEIKTMDRDRWGGWDWQYSEAQRRGELYVPWLDISLAQLRAEIQHQYPDAPLEPLWPNKKRFALCLTHDVDVVMPHPSLRSLVHTVRRHAGSDFNWRMRAWRAKGLVRDWIHQLRSHTGRHFRNFEEWMKLEDSFGFKSTFFFVPSRLHHRHAYDCNYQFHDIVYHGDRTMMVSEMMQTLDGAGWEVGLHGSYQSAVENSLLIDERQQIEDILGHPIVSTRQHWLHYDVQVTPCLQAEAGFRVDSTQGFNRSIGFRAGTAFPYWCWDHQTGQSLPVLEIPQHIMDGGLFQANSLEYCEALAIRHSVEIMDAVERVGGCLTLSWHPHTVNNEKYWVVYKTLLEEAARRNAWGCSAGDVYKWWTERERRLLFDDAGSHVVGYRDEGSRVRQGLLGACSAVRDHD